MVAHVIIAYLHFLGIMALMATLLAEHVILQPRMSRLHMQRLIMTDLLYGTAAGVVLITGLSRWAHFGKGTSFYLQNPVFYVKVSLFLLVALLSIAPTLQFLSWRKALKSDDLPVLDPQRVTLPALPDPSGIRPAADHPSPGCIDGPWHWPGLLMISFDVLPYSSL